MEQRIYRGTIEPEALADYLVQHFDPQENLQAQKIGQGGAQVVQIGRGDVPAELRHAITLAIAPNQDGTPGVTVTMGQQQWLDSKMATYVAIMGIISLVVTPWALFALLWPITEAVGNTTFTGEVWSAVENFVLSNGGTLTTTQE